MFYYKNEKELINMLTKSEEEILDLLWTENRPMTSTEIVNLSVNRTWKKSYIHLLINSLLKKEVIKVEGFVKTTKNYARTFIPVFTREEYAVKQFTDSSEFNKGSKENLFAALIENTDDPQVIDKLEKMIERKKQELKC